MTKQEREQEREERKAAIRMFEEMLEQWRKDVEELGKDAEEGAEMMSQEEINALLLGINESSVSFDDTPRMKTPEEFAEEFTRELQEGKYDRVLTFNRSAISDEEIETYSKAIQESAPYLRQLPIALTSESDVEQLLKDISEEKEVKHRSKGLVIYNYDWLLEHLEEEFELLNAVQRT